MTNPNKIDWTELQFGVEIEFVGGTPKEIELLPDWVMSLDEQQIDDTGEESGSELKPPPMKWAQRDQIRLMLERLRASGAAANWSCGLHVHVGIELYGQPAIPSFIDAAVRSQDTMRELLQTSEDRLIYCPPITEQMREQYHLNPVSDALRHKGRPQSHRCGINLAAWFDIGTVEYRYANGSLDDEEVLNTIELCLRFTAAIGAGQLLPNDAPEPFARALGAPLSGYPPIQSAPRWYKERIWLENALLPALAPLAQRLIPGSEIHHILPSASGLTLAIEDVEGIMHRFQLRLTAGEWEVAGRL
ncbi:amidoligase family protein [Paenibacillus kobensis]|uniref:amidoligase family protein n=1 Tax=Paenibacillus kobensis TaxID=59841 RepID=UPI0013E297EA|nr:amidoligase family protein [Paenibacillus kobensis]